MPRIPTPASWLQGKSLSAQSLKGHKLSASRFKDNDVSANCLQGHSRSANGLKGFMLALLTLASLSLAQVQAQDSYPSKPIRMIVPLAAGSAVDGAARLLTAKMSQNMGQPIVIENITGSSGLIGADRLAKANPGKINYGSGGSGSPQHIAMALFAQRTGIDLVHVPYKGATPAAIAAAAGQVEVTYQGLGTVTSLIQGGKLRLLAVSTPERLAQYPNVPTIVQAGISDFFFNSWFAMIAPAGTPKPIIDKLNAEMQKALTDPQTRERLIALGVTIRGTSAAEFKQATEKQYALYGKLIKDNKIQAD